MKHILPVVAVLYLYTFGLVSAQEPKAAPTEPTKPAAVPATKPVVTPPAAKAKGSKADLATRLGGIERTTQEVRQNLGRIGSGRTSIADFLEREFRLIHKRLDDLDKEISLMKSDLRRISNRR